MANLHKATVEHLIRVLKVDHEVFTKDTAYTEFNRGFNNAIQTLEAFLDVSEPTLNERETEMLTGLLSATEGCRDDMHEPDENDVMAEVFNPKGKLDNAFGNEINPDAPWMNEIVVRIITGRIEEDRFDINLADLIALARKVPLN